MKNRKFSALIFDFDGLILDTEEPAYQAWQEIYQEYGCVIPLSTWVAVIGTSDHSFDPISDLSEKSGKTLDRVLVTARHRAREVELIQSQAILPGVMDYLVDARRLGLKIGLASSSSCRWVTGHLERLGLLSYFDCICASDDVDRTKPDPALYLAALAGLNVLADEAIAFEDSLNGVLAAKRAGLFCVVVPNSMTRHLPLDEADLRLISLADLQLKDLVVTARLPTV